MKYNQTKVVNFLKNNFNLDQNKLNELFEIAGKKMGVSSAEVKRKFENAVDVNNLGNVDLNDNESIKKLLNSPHIKAKLAKNKKVAEMIKSLMEEK